LRKYIEMNTPLVSIIIPTYNRANLISETLDSILAQTYQNWECIVVDDGSNDATSEVMVTYCVKDTRFQYHQRPKNKSKGANACRNYGFELSKGEYVNWFDDDDLMLPLKLETQVEHLKEKMVNMTVCQSQVFENSKDNVLGLRKSSIYSDDFFNDFITNKIKWLTQSPLLKRSFLLDNNITFDECLTQSQERDFFVKVLNKLSHYHYDNESYVLLRKHEKSISYGNKTPDKIESNFKVNYTILNTYRYKINTETKSYLVKFIKANLLESLKLKNKTVSSNIYQKLMEIEEISIIEKIKIYLGFLFYKYFNKGELFFK